MKRLICLADVSVGSAYSAARTRFRVWVHKRARTQAVVGESDAANSKMRRTTSGGSAGSCPGERRRSTTGLRLVLHEQTLAVSLRERRGWKWRRAHLGLRTRLIELVRRLRWNRPKQAIAARLRAVSEREKREWSGSFRTAGGRRPHGGAAREGRSRGRVALVYALKAPLLCSSNRREQESLTTLPKESGGASGFSA